MTTANGRPADRLCKACGTPYGSYVNVPCQGEGCIDCQLIAPWESHWELEVHVDDKVTYRCPHGTMFDQLCKRCGAKVGGWGVGAAGFGELCGCGAD